MKYRPLVHQLVGDLWLGFWSPECSVCRKQGREREGGRKGERERERERKQLKKMTNIVPSTVCCVIICSAQGQVYTNSCHTVHHTGNQYSYICKDIVKPCFSKDAWPTYTPQLDLWLSTTNSHNLPGQRRKERTNHNRWINRGAPP